MSKERHNQNRTAIVYFGPSPQDYLGLQSLLSLVESNFTLL